MRAPSKEEISKALRTEDALAGWARLLALGRRAHALLDVPRTDYWWLDDRIAEWQGRWSGRDPIRGTYPWQRRPGSARFSLRTAWVRAVERALENNAEAQFPFILLGAIRFGDERFRSFIEDGKRYRRRFEHLEECNLVPLPSGSWWKPVEKIKYLAAANPSFCDGLKNLAPTELPVRLLRRESDLFKSKGTKPSPERFHVRLVLVDAPPDKEWFKLRAVENRRTQRPAFTFECISKAWQRTAVEAARSGWFQEADVTLLPEMIMPQGLWSELEEICTESPESQALLIPGSGHVVLPGDQRTANRMGVIFSNAKDPNNQPRVAYLKSYAFAIKKERTPDFFEELLRRFGKGQRWLWKLASDEGFVLESLEAIGGTREWPLICIDSPWGRLGFAICRDLLLDVHNMVVQSLVEAGVDHLFVPSYNPGRDADFVRALETLRRHDVATYLVDGASGGKKKTKGYVQLPTRKLVRVGYDSLLAEERKALLEPTEDEQELGLHVRFGVRKKHGLRALDVEIDRAKK